MGVFWTPDIKNDMPDRKKLMKCFITSTILVDGYLLFYGVLFFLYEMVKRLELFFYHFLFCSLENLNAMGKENNKIDFLCFILYHRHFVKM